MKREGRGRGKGVEREGGGEAREKEEHWGYMYWHTLLQSKLLTILVHLSSSPPLLLPLSLFPFSLLPFSSLLETVFIEILLLETFLLIKTKMERCLQKLLTLDCQGELIMASCWHTLVQNLVLWMRLIKRMLLFVLARN